MEKTNKIERTYFILNCRKFPVTIIHKTEFGKEFYDLSFDYNKELIEELKASTEMRQWKSELKAWRLGKTPRNDFVLSFLKGENPYSLYDTEYKNHIHRDALEGFWKHQVQMLYHVLTRKRCIVAGQTRVGKTKPILRAIQILCCEGAWWVAPKSALRGLTLELDKWQFPHKIYLLTYDKFRRELSNKTERALIESVPKVVVFDEAHKLKNPRSIQGQTARDVAAAQVIKYGDDAHTILLSGTPAPKDPSDWWNLAEICCPGFLREGSKIQLAKRLGEFEQREGQVGQMYWHLIKWKKEEVEFLHKRLAGMVEVYLRKDCLDLPQKMRVQIKLTPTVEYIKAARMLRKIETKPAQLQMKLRLLSDGVMYVNDINELTAKKFRSEVKFFPDCPKDTQLINDLEEFEDVGRVVVGNAFQGSMDKLIKLCVREGWAVLKIDGRGWEAINTSCSVDDCLYEMDGSHPKSLIQGEKGSPEYKIPKLVALVNQASGSTGLEFSASPVIINYSLAFNAADQEQFEGRCYSNNMDKIRGLEIRDYINLPIDDLVRRNVELKRTMQSVTMGDIDAIMKEVW